MAIGKGPDEITELTQDRFMTLIREPYPVLLLLRKLPKHPNIPVPDAAEQSLRDAYTQIQSQVIVFLADSGQAFARNIAKLFNVDSSESKIVIFQPNTDKKEHKPLQKYKMISPKTAENIINFVHNFSIGNLTESKMNQATLQPTT